MEPWRLGKTEQWKSFSRTKKAETLLFYPIPSFQEKKSCVKVFSNKTTQVKFQAIKNNNDMII